MTTIRITSALTLPAYPGYVLGGIISEEQLLLPLYEKRVAILQKELEKAISEKEAKKNSKEFLALNKEGRQKELAPDDTKVNKLRDGLLSINTKITKLAQSVDPFRIEEALPLDPQIAKVRIELRSFESERVDHLIFKSKDQVLSRLQAFVSQLFLQDAPSSILPLGQLEAMARNVENLLGTGTVSVAVVGSFVCLDRVKMIEPLAIRPKISISEELKQNAARYFVFSEAVLGGVFLAIAKDFSAVGNAPGASSDKKWSASLASLSFISLGVLPKLQYKVDDLWSVLIDWRKALSDNQQSGYPIGFKVRCLKDVFEENHIIPKQPLLLLSALESSNALVPFSSKP